MNPEKTKQLVETFPEIFDKDFHFECDDGWFGLIQDCCESLQDLKEVPKATQVKEKFGQLRFYVDNHTDGANAVTGFYECQSAYRCEVCGSFDGEVCTTGYWLKTVCPEHRIAEDGREFKPRAR